MKPVIKVLVLIFMVMVMGVGNALAQSGDTLQLEVDLLGQNMDGKEETPGTDAPEEGVKENLPAQPVSVKIAPVPQVKPAEDEVAGKREDSEESLFSSIGKSILGWFGGVNTKGKANPISDSEFERSNKEDFPAFIVVDDKGNDFFSQWLG